MSLREKVLQQKAAKAEMKEQEVASSKEQEQAARKQQLDSLITKRSAIAEIKATTIAATEGMKGAKTKLKTERQNLRLLHKESIDEETGEAALPKPAELVRGEEFQGEEEIQRYNQAREAFNLSADNVKEVQKQLAELGIENPSELLPGQLEATLEERERELNNEARTFVLEHPDVDPEMTAQVKEELVTARRNEISKELEGWKEPGIYRTFYDTLRKESKQGREKDGHISKLTLTPALQKGLETLTTSPEDRQRYVKVLDRVFKNSSDSLSEMDRDAVGQAIAEHMVSDGTHFYEDQTTALEDALERETYYDKRNGKETVESELSPEDAKADRMETYRRKKKEMTKQALDRIQNSPEVRRAADTLIKNYQKVAEYQSIPNQIKGFKERSAEIDKRLDNSGRRYSESSTLAQEESQLGTTEQNLDANKKKVAAEIQTLKEVPANLLALSALPQEVLAAPMKIDYQHYGANYGVDIQGIWNYPKARELYTENEKDTKTAEDLTARVGYIERGKDGFFGPSKEKKEDIAKLKERMQELFGDTEGGVEEAKEQTKNLERTVATREAECQKLKGMDEEMRGKVAPIYTYAHLLGKEGFQGTVTEFMDALREKVAKSLPELEAQQAALDAEKGQLAGKKDELRNEKSQLEVERRSLVDQVITAEERQRQLKQELQKSGDIQAYSSYQ